MKIFQTLLIKAVKSVDTNIHKESWYPSAEGGQNI